MDAGTTIPRDRVGETLATLQAYAVEGSRTPEVLGFARAHARAIGAEPQPLDVFRRAYDDVRTRWVLASDPYGEEHVQRPAAALTSMGGDCDDVAPLLASIARACGLRAALQVIRTEGIARHVRAAVETNPGHWQPFDVGSAAYAIDAPSIDVETLPLDDRADTEGLGFLPAVVGLATAGAGLASTIIGGKSQRRAADTQAEATRYAADRQASAIEAQARAARVGSYADLAATHKATRAAQAMQSERLHAADVMGRRVLAFVEDVFPAVLVLALVRYVVPPVAEALGR